MAKRKDWHYSNARGMLVGVMICNNCRQKIAGNEQYKYHEDKDGCFRGHLHRECSLDDPRWVLMDKQEEARRKHMQDYLEAMIKFRDQWETFALDEEIGEYQSSLSNQNKD